MWERGGGRERGESLGGGWERGESLGERRVWERGGERWQDEGKVGKGREEVGRGWYSIGENVGRGTTE